YIFQNNDGRIVFAIPYHDNRLTLIGTTDVDVGGDPDAAVVSLGEIEYLCSAISEYFAKPVSPQDVVWSFAGIRPLFDDGAKSAQKVTRDFVLDLDAPDKGAPLLNIFGGKITTYRRLAMEVLDKLEEWLAPMKPEWTGKVPLPGGDFAIGERPARLQKLISSCPQIDKALLRRLFETYGTCAGDVLGECTKMDQLGTHFGSGLYQREVEYLREREWAQTAEDILWRRTKLGLDLTKGEQDALADWLAENQ
ncbi:MAG TPA: FAD-dependent oxidoreductase, partial [Rhizobiales bacterium]|nr:FAD-dependent oxidoreductase [Hyphomicrobiales bacterium]